jgi:hypothetical protein
MVDGRNGDVTPVVTFCDPNQSRGQETSPATLTPDKAVRGALTRFAREGTERQRAGTDALDR